MVSRTLPLRPTPNRLWAALLMFYYILEAAVLLCVPDSWRPEKSLTGQTVLITGSASGIGQLMALQFARLGIGKLVLWDVNEEGMRQTEELVKKQNSKIKIYIYKVNLANREEIYETAKRVLSDLGGAVDILVNNAGVVSGALFLDNSDDKVRLTYDINVLAHFYTVRAFLPEMIKQKRGHLVTVASAAGHLAGPKVVDYCGSKFANVGFDLALRMELAQADLDEAIQTTIVKPWLISTGMFEGAQPGIIPYLKPEYVAEQVVRAVRLNIREVILPGYLVVLFTLFLMLPHKALIAVGEFAGGMDAMANFRGRAGKEKEETNNNK